MATVPNRLYAARSPEAVELWIPESEMPGYGGAALANTFIGYGSGAGALTGDANLTYDATNGIATMGKPPTGYLRLIGGTAGALNLDGDGAIRF